MPVAEMEVQEVVVEVPAPRLSNEKETLALLASENRQRYPWDAVMPKLSFIWHEALPMTTVPA
jgi:hypothetical protein